MIEMWRSPWRQLKSGYVACAVVYQDGTRGMVQQHVELAEQRLGRRLREDEVVHHKNEVKNDNRLDNLEVLTRADHARLHARRRAS